MSEQEASAQQIAEPQDPPEQAVTTQDADKPRRGRPPKALIEAERKAVEALSDAETVLANVPARFHILITHAEKYTIEPGVQKLKRYVAEHDWAKAHGVSIIDPKDIK